jgi:hypothetical protein
MKEAHSEYDTSRWTFQRGRRSVVAFAFVALAAAACGGGGDTSTGPGNQPPPTATPTGSYSIKTINNTALPVGLYPATPDYKYEVTAGSLVLTADGKYTVMTTYKQTITGNVSTFVDSTGGTWVLTGTSVAFTNGQDASKDNATFDKDQLTFAEANGKVTPLSVKLGPKSIGLPKTLVDARLAAAVDPMTYVYKK